MFTLLVQFVLLIVDRALYLRRNMTGKIIFHVISVIALHYWQFQYLDHLTHTVSWPPMLFYFVKCIYFLLSAYQIRCGYPKRVSGNFANNQFTLLHRRVFESYVLWNMHWFTGCFFIEFVSIFFVFWTAIKEYHFCPRQEHYLTGFASKQLSRWLNGSKWMISTQICFLLR